MSTPTAGWLDTPATKVVLRTTLYYALLVALGWLGWRLLPQAGLTGEPSIEALFGGAGIGTTSAAGAPARAELPLAVTGLIAMIAAIMLSLPVAWMYQLTRAKRGFQQSVVQLLIILPIIVAGIVVLVKFSLALAFSLAGIVAAVRFRNTLDDSKDAVYVFLAIGIGLAAAVNVPVAFAISLLFNATVAILWFTDFGHSPVELEGRIAQRRLQRARQLARTGTFVAQIDNEVLRNMTREQLEGLAQRAWRQARDRDDAGPEATNGSERRLRLRTTDAERTRRAIEARLDEACREWRFASMSDAEGGNGARLMEYVIRLKKKSDPDDLLALARAVCAPELVDAELR